MLPAINNNNSNTYYLLLHYSSQHTGPGGWREDGLDRYEGPQSKMASILQVVISKGITSLKVSKVLGESVIFQGLSVHCCNITSSHLMSDLTCHSFLVL